MAIGCQRTGDIMLTPEEEKFVKNHYQAFIKTAELQTLNEARRDEEQQLVIDFKINEANQARADLVAKYQSLMSPIQSEIQTLKSAN